MTVLIRFDVNLLFVRQKSTAHNDTDESRNSPEVGGGGEAIGVLCGHISLCKNKPTQLITENIL